ncbi:unnamed protein product [Choristocarpus tenellus]
MSTSNITGSTPFPWKPMLVISWALLSHSFALSSLFPYVGYMVQDIGVARSKDEAGFYAGYVASAFMLGRFCSSYFWGRFSDVHGRKPGLYVGLLAIAVFSLGFGMSQSFCWALACRFLLGAMNGIVGISKTMISEICGKEHEVDGMGFITTSWSIGMVVGPGLGGLLARPAVNMPSLFSDTGLFARYPYLLVNMVNAGMGLVGLPLLYFALPETYRLNSVDTSTWIADFPLVAVSYWPFRFIASFVRGRNYIEKDNNSSVELLILLGDKGRNETPMADEEKNLLPSYHGAHHDHSPLSQALDYSSTSETSEEKERESYRAGIVTMLETRGWQTPSLGCKKFEERKTSDEFKIGGSKYDLFTVCFLHCVIGIDLWVPFCIIASMRTLNMVKFCSLVTILVSGFDESFPLWALSSIHLGGLDWTTVEIGKVLSFSGIGMIVFQVSIYPQLMKVLGVVRAQRLALSLLVPILLIVPNLNFVHGSGVWLTIATVAVVSSVRANVNVIFVTMALATNACVPASQRGTLNGLAMSIGSMGKAAGPTLASTLFAWSIATDEGVQSSTRSPSLYVTPTAPTPHSLHSFPFDYHLVFYLLALGFFLVGVGVWLKIPLELMSPTSCGKVDIGQSKGSKVCGSVESSVDSNAAA